MTGFIRIQRIELNLEKSRKSCLFVVLSVVLVSRNDPSGDAEVSR
jgi:hypothetical protein